MPIKNVLVLGHNNKFEKLLVECLSQRYTVHTKLNLHHIEELKKNHIDAIVFDALELRKELKKEIEILSQLAIQKIIYLEDASSIYLNSKNALPYSVYKKIIPKNRKCSRLKKYEETLLKNETETVIFRISEMFGSNAIHGLIHDLLHKNCVTVNNGERDFIYEGDVIHAIEVALETDSNGIFDIASGQSISIKTKLVDLINSYRSRKIKVKFRKSKKVNTVYNCENFKYYKWEPLVSLECGLNVINNKRRNDEKVSTASI